MMAAEALRSHLPYLSPKQVTKGQIMQLATQLSPTCTVQLPIFVFLLSITKKNSCKSFSKILQHYGIS